MDHPPIRNRSELLTADARTVTEQTRYELRQLIRTHSFTQEQLGLALGRSQSTVSNWLRSPDRVLSPSGAAALDKGFEIDGRTYNPQTTLDVTWTELVGLRRARQPREVRPRTAPNARDIWQVFLASPIASLEQPAEYEAERQAALDLKAAIETYCGLSVYYAGEKVPSLRELQSPEMAAEINFAALNDARFFVLSITQRLNRPSSVFPEAGFALACGIPSVYFCVSPEVLPFCLQNLNQHNVPHLPPVSQHYKKSTREVTDYIKTNGRALFQRLADKARRAR